MHNKFFELGRQIWGDKVTDEEMKTFVEQVEINFIPFGKNITHQIFFDNYIEALMSSVDDLAFELDSEGVIVKAWAADETRFFVSRDVFMYKKFTDILPKPLSQLIENAFAAVKKNKFPHEIEYTSPLDKRHFVARFNVIKDVNPSIEHFSVLVRDITQKKAAEKDLKIAIETANAALNAKSHFLSSVSHEIRTPMNAIVGLTDILLEQEHSGETTEYLRSIKHSSENLLILINDILNFSKIDAGKVQFEQIDFDLHDQIKELEKTFGIRAVKKNIIFDVNILPEVPKIIIGDPYRLNQILTNLIGNAIKFTNKGFVKVAISLLNQDDEKVNIKFEISDSGIGIPEEKFERVFESFVQAMPDTARKYGGSGLGLAITKNLVTQQQGSILLKSKEGKGSTFTVEMPYLKSNTKSLTKAEVDPNTASLANTTILVAEDNALNQLVIKKILDDWQANYFVVENGREAIETLKQKNVDLVLMDLHMPEMDGMEATAHIRAKDSVVLNPDVPIIAFTADAFPETRIKVLECGMNDFVTKPFKKNELYSKIVKQINP